MNQENSPKNVLSIAQSFVSAETNWLHIYSDKRPFIRGDSISIYHNFLYAYILLATKEKAKMEEGIAHLKRLLHFQITSGESCGNFPKYLHQFPDCERKFEIVNVLLPIYKIYVEFSSVIPKPDKQNLIKAINEALESLQRITENQPLSYIVSAQVYSLFFVFGNLTHNSDLISKGEENLRSLLAQGTNKAWGCSRHLSKLILYFGLISPTDNRLNLMSFWNYLLQTWSCKHKAFIGPALNEHYYQSQTEPTLYHHFMCYQHKLSFPELFNGDFLETILLPKSIELNQFTDPISSENFSYALSPFLVSCNIQSNYTVSTFSLNENQWEKRGGFYPLRILIHNGTTMSDHFVLAMGSICKIEKINQREYSLCFNFGDSKELDISFFTNLSSQVKVETKGVQATMFNGTNPIDFIFKEEVVRLSLISSESSEKVWGHLVKDNRRSQMCSGFNHIYDWHLYFRTTEKQINSPLKMKLELLPRSGP